VNPTRLFVLGALARRGPMYGHQLRRHARVDRADLWSDVRPGSLYSALHRLEAEGLIDPLRTEKSGNLPARTVYAITPEGRQELRALRSEALGEVRLRPDPVDLALAVSADLDEDTLRGYVEDRIGALSAQRTQFDHHRDRAWPDQTVADDLVTEHARMRIDAELGWHKMVLDRIDKLAADGTDQTDGRTDGRSDGHADGHADGRIDGTTRTDGTGSVHSGGRGGGTGSVHSGGRGGGGTGGTSARSRTPL